jgi:hypothetical protein
LSLLHHHHHQSPKSWSAQELWRCARVECDWELCCERAQETKVKTFSSLFFLFLTQ